MPTKTEELSREQIPLIYKKTYIIMKVYRITVFLYLGFALFFLYDAYVEYQREGDYWIRLIFAAMALFLFFFRQRSIRNMEERKKNQQ